MFKRDRNIDIVKTQAKVLDPKRDSFNRLKHLRIFLDHVENQEAKEFFTTNYSPVFFIFHDAFSIVESNIRIKGVHKSQREEFEQVRFLLEKILTLLPELLAEGWQGHSIRVIMKKMLHHGNSFKMLCEGIRLFIIWYQALREAAPVEVDQMFSQLVPFATPIPVASSCQRSAAECGLEESTASASQNKDAIFYIVPENEPGAVVASEYNLMFPPVPGEPQPDDMSSALLEYLLQTMVTQVTKIQWARLVVNGVRQYERCFSFLLERFRVVYIPYLFPNMSPSMYSLYNPNLDLPAAVRSDSVLLSRPQSVVLTWLVSHVTPVRDEREAGATRNAQRMDSSLTFYAAKIAWSSQMVVEDDIVRMVSILPRSDFLTIVHRAVARNVLFATPGNVDFVHEMFRQCLVSPLGQTLTTKKIIAVYREWIQMTHPDPPSFLVEQPFADQPKNPVYCGQQNLYKVFMTNASNFFLLSLPPGESQLLAEQVDLCKRVMNIYRFMVMKKLMERPTWEQLLYVILHVTSQVLSHDSPKKAVSGSSVGVSGVQAVSQVSGGAMISCTYGGETLGQQLAAALFQTLIVTWIKANLHATICVDLWNGFVRVLSSLAHWEPLVDEWAKTMKTLTRILTTRVYGLDLDNLPLDRLSEQQSKRRRALGGATKFGGRLSQDVDNSGMAGQVLGHVGSATCGGLPIGSRGNRGHLIDAEGAHKTSLIQHGRRAGASPTDMLSRTGCSSAGGMSGGISAASSLLRRMSDSHVLLHRRLEFRQRACHSCTAWPNRALVRSFSQQAIWNGNISSSGTNVSSFQLQGVVICALHQELSASPAASSSVLESSSIKEQQLMNHMMDCASSDNGGESAGETDGRSVLAGGTRKGWCPEVAAVLWRRMLCCLGNVNQIADPGIHAKVIDQLSQLCDTLIKVRENQGVCEDGSVSAVPPSFIPPVHLLCPWLFDATQLGDEYEKGRLTAYTLLCDLALRWHDIPLSAEFVTRFYDVLHRGLWVGASWKLRQNLVRVAGCRFFGARLPGFTLLALDFTRAAADILSQPTLKATPRSEAVRCLGSLMFLGNLYGELSALDPTQAPTAAKQPSKPLQVIPLTNLEEEVVASLMRAASSDPDWQARCTGLCAISVWIYQQLLCRSYHGKVIPALIVLLQSLQPSSTVCSQQKSAAVKLLVASKCGQYTVCQTAAECLALLAEFAPALLKDIPHLPEVIVKSLSSVVCQLFPSSSGQQDINEGLATLITSLMFCLAEWLMAVPQDELTGGPVPSSLHCALSALDGVIRGSPRSSDIAR